MRVPKRFGLSTLLLLIFGVTTIFGFLAWRTNRLKAEVSRINKAGVGHLTLSKGWFWPVIGDEAYLRLKKDVRGGLHVAEKLESQEVVLAKFEQASKEMRELGVKEIEILYAEETPHQGTTVDVMRVIHTDDLGKSIERLAE